MVQKITFAEMRDMWRLRPPDLLCGYHCSHSLAISGDAWPDDLRLSDLEVRFVCKACGKRGADVTELQLEQESNCRDGLWLNKLH